MGQKWLSQGIRFWMWCPFVTCLHFSGYALLHPSMLSSQPLINGRENNALIIHNLFFFQALSSQSLLARKKSTTLRMACRVADTHYRDLLLLFMFVTMVTSLPQSHGQCQRCPMIGSFVGVFYEIAFTRSQGSEWCWKNPDKQERDVIIVYQV